MDEYIGYEEALAIIEKFMTNTGIRNYCTNVCKGNCCGACYTSPDACHKNEGRRISCSIFLCQSLCNILFTTKSAANWYWDVHRRVGTAVAFVRNKGAYGGGNPYFNPMTKKMIKNFKIAPDFFGKPPSIKRIRSVMGSLECLNDMIERRKRFLEINNTH